MDKQEFGKIAMALKTYYPRETLLPNNEAAELWFMQLQDIPYNVAVAALNQWVATNRWSPSISDLRALAADITTGGTDDWGAAWEKTLKIIGKYGYYRQAEALAALPEVAAETVRRIGWEELCHSENLTADRANFRTIYEQLSERKRRDAQLPPALKEAIGKIQIGMIEKEA